MSEPRWLTSEQQEAWLPFAGMLLKLPAALDSQLLRDSNMTHFEYLVMVFLSQAPDRTMRMSELANTATASLSRLSHVVKRLERRGWVRREPSPEDGRYTNAILTETGFDKLAAAAPGHVAAVREYVIDALSETQLHELGKIGTRILEALDPDSVSTFTYRKD
jgi:DNA-binding MarR family transcriptional regulator